MNLLEIACFGVAGVPDGRYSFTDPSGGPLDWVVVCGPAGAGKTRLLELIGAAIQSIAPAGKPPNPLRWVRAGQVAAKVVLLFWLDEEERRFAGCAEVESAELILSVPAPAPDVEDGLVALLSRYGHRASARDSYFEAPGKLEYFPAGRTLAARGAGSLAEPEQRMLRLQKDPGKYAFVPRYLRELDEADGFASYLTLFAPGCAFDPAAARLGAPCFRLAAGARMLQELPGGMQDGVLIAATIAMIGLDRSLVLVDRPELAACPQDAARLVDAWRRIGRGTQVIAASSSEAIMASTPNEHLVRLRAD